MLLIEPRTDAVYLCYDALNYAQNMKVFFVDRTELMVFNPCYNALNYAQENVIDLIYSPSQTKLNLTSDTSIILIKTLQASDIPSVQPLNNSLHTLTVSVLSLIAEQ